MRSLPFVLLIALCVPALPLALADEQSLTHEAVLDAPVDIVWEAFTTKKAMESWMVAHAEVDLKVGGAWKTHYSKEGKLGDEGSIEHAILAYDPKRMFAFRTVKVPKTFPFPNTMKNVWSVLYMEPVETNRTRLVLRMLGYGPDAESQQMRKFFDSGNAYTIDQLKKYLAKVQASN